MRISFDAAKRAATLEERGLDFADAAEVFDGITAETEDTRKDYGEARVICFGLLRGRLVQVVYTQRDAGRHIISMRKANAREKARLAPILGI
ncbi:MAG: BrnT family toxin [Pseudomonadota bacterium]